MQDIPFIFFYRSGRRGALTVKLQALLEETQLLPSHDQDLHEHP